MRSLFSLVGLLLVLAVVGYLAKSQLGAASSGSSAVQKAAKDAGVTLPNSMQGATPQQQSEQIQQQVKQAVEAAVAQPRVPEDEAAK